MAIILFVLNVYQFLTRQSALRMAEILYAMSRNVRKKAAEVRCNKKDVEIVEAHLYDITASAYSLLQVLRRRENSLDPEFGIFPTGNRINADSLVRLADNILFAAAEDSPDANEEEIVNRALDKFLEKVPNLEQDAAKKIITAVAQQSNRMISKQVSLSS